MTAISPGRGGGIALSPEIIINGRDGGSGGERGVPPACEEIMMKSPAVNAKTVFPETVMTMALCCIVSYKIV
jgi:hypothetical protein